MSQPTMFTTEEQPISGWSALWLVLVDPAGSFRRLGGQPAIFPGYALQMAAAALALILGLEVILAAAEAGMSAAANQPGAEQLPAGYWSITKWVTIGFAGAGALIGPWVAGLMVTLVALFVGQIQGGGPSFSAYFGMIGYARVPLAISTLLGGIWMAVMGKPLDLSLAVLAGPESSPAMKGLLTMFQPFTLWYYVLLAVGFAALFGRPARKGWAFPALLFIIGALVTAGMSALGGAFQPSM